MTGRENVGIQTESSENEREIPEKVRSAPVKKLRN
jgi:hypothetical protein